MDSLRNTPSNHCFEDLRPPQRTNCTLPPNCSCRALQHSGLRADGEHVLNVKGRQVSIYCYNMTSVKPLEFLTLKSGKSSYAIICLRAVCLTCYVYIGTTENYSIYYSKRARENQQCGDRTGEWHDPGIAYGTTRFHKIRIDIQTLKIIEDDYTFTDTVGKPQPFGSAGDCYSSSMSCPQGDFSINLTGTRFRIRPSTKWEASGQNSKIEYVIKVGMPLLTHTQINSLSF